MVSVTESGIAGGTTLIRIESLEMHALLELVRIYRAVSYTHLDVYKRQEWFHEWGDGITWWTSGIEDFKQYSLTLVQVVCI